MNTSEKGRRYEWAFREELYRRGAQWVMRAAASRGPFDLLAVFPDAICGYQLKNSGQFRCKTAERLKEMMPVWPNCIGYVVHRMPGREFCEH